MGTAVYDTCLETVILFVALFVAANGIDISNGANKCNFDDQIFVTFVFLTKKQWIPLYACPMYLTFHYPCFSLSVMCVCRCVAWVAVYWVIAGETIIVVLCCGLMYGAIIFRLLQAQSVLFEEKDLISIYFALSHQCHHTSHCDWIRCVAVLPICKNRRKVKMTAFCVPSIFF